MGTGDQGDAAAAADSEVLAAAERLESLGLNGNSSDLALATALVGIETLQTYYVDRDLLAAYTGATIKGQLEALDAIDSAEVTGGSGTLAAPGIIPAASASFTSPSSSPASAASSLSVISSRVFATTRAVRSWGHDSSRATASG